MTEHRCDHEEFCRFFFPDSKLAFHDGTRCMRNHDGCAKCSYDSRTSATPTPAVEGCPYWRNVFGMMVCRYREIGCVDEHDATIRKEVQDEIGLNCWSEYQMNNPRCLNCQIGERCYEKRESLRSAP